MGSPILKTGELYHVEGWNYKAQFILESIEGNVAILKYPKRNKRTKAPVNKLFYAKRTKKKLKPLEAEPKGDSNE